MLAVKGMYMYFYILFIFLLVIFGLEIKLKSKFVDRNLETPQIYE